MNHVFTNLHTQIKHHALQKSVLDKAQEQEKREHEHGAIVVEFYD